MRVIVTRPESTAHSWALGLAQAGFEPVLLPLIAIRPMDVTESLQQAWKTLGDYAAVMFVSGAAVKQFFASKPDFSDVLLKESATKTRAWATGPGTMRILLRCGVDPGRLDAPALDADQFDSEALWAVVRHRVKAGTRVLIVRGAETAGRAPQAAPDGAADAAAAALGSGRDWFARQLTDAGVQVDFVVAYQRSASEFNALQKSIASAAAQDGSIWLLSSSEAIVNLAAGMPGQSWQSARAVVTHPRIATQARKLGFGVVCESRPVLASVVASIESMG
jgi:uroporphyrinogen-III synthase